MWGALQAPQLGPGRSPGRQEVLCSMKREWDYSWHSISVVTADALFLLLSFLSLSFLPFSRNTSPWQQTRSTWNLWHTGRIFKKCYKRRPLSSLFGPLCVRLVTAPIVYSKLARRTRSPSNLRPTTHECVKRKLWFIQAEVRSYLIVQF